MKPNYPMKRIVKRIREILEETPEGATASEIANKIASHYNTQREQPKRISALCAHDITIAKVGRFQGDNVYALKKWREEYEQVE